MYEGAVSSRGRRWWLALQKVPSEAGDLSCEGSQRVARSRKYGQKKWAFVVLNCKTGGPRLLAEAGVGDHNCGVLHF